MLPALTLAYIGDTVYDLYVRTLLVRRRPAGAHALHMAAAGQVCAAGQAAAFRRVEPLLTGEELAVYRRGRNAHSGTVPKHASIADYRVATGLETLVGYLYLTGNDARLIDIRIAALRQDGGTAGALTRRGHREKRRPAAGHRRGKGWTHEANVKRAIRTARGSRAANAQKPARGNRAATA